MLKILPLLLLTLFCGGSIAIAQDDPYTRIQELIRKSQTKKEVANATEKGAVRYQKLRTPQSEVEDAILWMENSKMSDRDKQYIKFFSTYAIPEEDREDYVLCLSFVIHSLVGITDDINDENAGGYYPLAKREDGDFKAYHQATETLWWIDIRNYNWTLQAWEDVSKGDGYFVEPIVPHKLNGALRLMSGNAVVRADWFILHSMDIMQQTDIDIDVDFYSTLLYAKNKAPKNVDEWRKIWGLDIKKSRLIGNEYGTLVTRSTAVARHNRMLFGYRTELGYLYETYDVKNQLGKRDYLESMFLNKNIGEPPEISDAGEMFATNILGLQVYGLRDGAGNIVDFGDPTVVRHMNDVLGDVRVRTAHSCVDCHASGPLPSENTIDEFIKSQGKVWVYDKDDQLRMERNLLSDKFSSSVEDNQLLFARAVKRVNGLSVQENGSIYLKCVTNYKKDLTIEQVAYECGVPQEEFVKTVKEKQKNYRYGGHIKHLVQNNAAIPRDIWESPGRDGIPGSFQQAMIVLNGLTIIEESEFQELRVKVYYGRKEYRSVKLYSGDKVVEEIPYGQYLLPTGSIVNQWLEVYSMSGKRGYIQLHLVSPNSFELGTAQRVFRNVKAEQLQKIISAN